MNFGWRIYLIVAPRTISLICSVVAGVEP